MTDVQSVTFYKNKWTPFQARKWLEKNKFNNNKLDITSGMLRFRQRDPFNYSRYSTKVLPNGINLVVGYK